MKRPPSLLLTVPEASRALGVSESTLWRLLRGKTIESVERSGRRLVPRSAVERRLRAPALSKKAVPFSEAHPLWRLVGAFRGPSRGPGSADKYGALFDE